MFNLRANVVLSYVTLSTLSVSQNGFAFTLNGASDSRGWDTKDLEFHLNAENCPDSVRDLLNDSIAIWNNVPTSNLTVSLGSDTADSLEDVANGGGSQLPAIFCNPNFSSTDGVDPNSIPGFATGQQFNGDGNIVTGYIVLNVQENAGANISTLNQDTVKVVLAHEIGHVLGLGHSTDTNALMYFDASAKTQLSIAKDDQDGVSYLYPREELSKDKIMGCSTIGVKNRSSSQSPYLLFALLCLAPLFCVRTSRLKKN